MLGAGGQRLIGGGVGEGGMHMRIWRTTNRYPIRSFFSHVGSYYPSWCNTNSYYDFWWHIYWQLLKNSEWITKTKNIYICPQYAKYRIYLVRHTTACTLVRVHFSQMDVFNFLYYYSKQLWCPNNSGTHVIESLSLVCRPVWEKRKCEH